MAMDLNTGACIAGVSIRNHRALEFGEAGTVVLVREDRLDANSPCNNVSDREIRHRSVRTFVVTLSLVVVVEPNPAAREVADVSCRLDVTGLRVGLRSGGQSTVNSGLKNADRSGTSFALGSSNL